MDGLMMASKMWTSTPVNHAAQYHDHQARSPQKGRPASISTSTKCAMQCAEQKMPLIEAVSAMNQPPFSCPLCSQTFPMKKTLSRHVSASIRAFEGSPVVCDVDGCLKRFARKDILERHKASQHGVVRVLVQCSVCQQWVRPRSLKGHQDTQVCLNARSQNRTTQGQAVTRDNRRQDDAWEAFCSLSSHLHEILDCVLLAAWLFTELRPWGPSDTTSSLWFAKAPPPPMEEVEKLKGKFFKTLKTSIDAPDTPWNGHLLDAIAIIKVVTVMTEGWNESDIHSDGYKRLADTQIRRMKLTKDQFINSPRSQVWDSVLLKMVSPNDRAKCITVIERILGVIRIAAWDSVSTLTDNFTKPLGDDAIRAHTKSFTPMAWFNGYGTHIIEINDIAMTVEQWGEPLVAQSSFVAVA